MGEAYNYEKPLPRVNLNIPDGKVPQCLLEGVRDILRTNNPNAASGKFVPQERLDLSAYDDAVEYVILHCASKALGVCMGELTCVVRATGRVPASAAIFEESVETIDCFQRDKL